MAYESLITEHIMFSRSICLLVWCCISLQLRAQICQGSLGDPIINISFGAGNNPGAPLSAATTNYTYVSTDCPKDGQYAVRNRTENCFDTTWFTVTDHTGDANGYFMLVNASFAPGEFYRDTVKGLCPGNTYEFAAWVINIKKPVLCYGATQIINPDITFRIESTDGTLLQSYNSGSIVATTPPQWNQYGFFFTMPSNVSDVVVRMVNNAPGGCGNDLGLDDITFRPCGPQVNSNIEGHPSSTDSICGGVDQTVTFTAQASAGYNNPGYQWQRSVNGAWQDIPGATSTQYTASFPANTPAGSYQFRIVTAENGNIGSPKCRVASQVLEIIVLTKPQMNVTSNSPVCAGNTIQLSATGDNVSWTGPNQFSGSGNAVQVTNATPANAGLYYATTAGAGCTWKDSVAVQVMPSPSVQLNTDSARICETDSVALNASGASTYRWIPSAGISDPAAASVIAKPSSSTLYQVIGSNNAGCADTAMCLVTVMKRPLANAGADFSMLENSTVSLNGSAQGDSIRYYWTPPYNMVNDRSLNPSVSPLVDTTYALHVESLTGCGLSIDSVRVTIYKNIIIPNAFSPNGDGWNDAWVIPGLYSYPDAEVVVFDRYGREVLRKRGFTSWDGKRNGQPVPVATYYYVIDLRNGTPKITGWLYLAR